MIFAPKTPKQLIDDYLKEHVSPFLKQKGFSKRGRTWSKNAVDFSFIINVQANKWNQLNQNPQFFVNYGIFVPKFYEEHFHMPIPENPKECDCILRERLLDKKGDEVWEIHAGSRKSIFGRQYNNLENQLLEAIESQSFKLFSEIQSIDDIQTKLR